jgi:NADPH-dependent 2,4-dienoyl-CoA reductase/sulfur reductase-like enzyme
MSAAAQARRMTSAGELEIVAFERGSRTSYAACGLPTWSGGSSIHPELLIARTPEQHRANGIDTMASTVTARDLETGRESIEHCDELLIGTGASGIGPPWPGIDAQGVLQLRTLGDAAELGRRLDAGARRAVVVGRRLHRTGGRGGAPHYIGVAIFATVGLVIAGAIMGAVI